MSGNSPNIVGFCCGYTLDVDDNVLKKSGLLQENVKLIKVSCSGKIEVNQLLDAFTDGASAVFVAGCANGTCHNLKGSKSAEKRVGYAKEILKEMDMNPDLVEMFFVPRKETEPVLRAVKEMLSRV
jgi:F420-non-reducing hydrogenase iron-sulfur subunit